MKCFGKRAQSGGSAAILVLLILLMIVFYLMFIPKTDRDDLIGTTSTNGNNVAPGSVNGSLLLNEHPGTLTTVEKNWFDHVIPSFNLFTKKEDTIMKNVGSIYVESKEGKMTKTMLLSTNDKTENAKLSFSVNEHSGNLIINQNGKDIFQGEVESFVEPLDISLEKDNIFEFSVDSVPWYKPFSKNYYDLRDIKVTATVELLDNKQALQTVLLSQDETNLLSTATLAFMVDCDIRNVGRLTIYLNNGLISSKVPDCGSGEKLPIDPKDLITGKNEFRFVAEQGTYLIDQMMLKTELKEPIYPLYFFNINESIYRKINSNKINSSIIIDFVKDDTERKIATLDINNQKTQIDTRVANYSKNIDSFIKEGSNFIRIIPETTLNIVQMKVVLDCKKDEDCT
jgi:hypothetical protein